MAISPLLQNKIQEQKISNPKHEKVYENLKKHANDVRPNAPKAKLVNENPIQSIKSYLEDTKQDFVNFAKTVKTGSMSDNNIGRLNDLGMKIGGLLIATFLAAHSRNKNESVMRFVGTAAFFASMKLWPKIFLNLPAKLIHKVDIGKRYISAQGDKKDFYLDNQFLPWDITDIKDEKEQRRHQKVALQNRTLWMATAGVSVPVMTALISNRLEPVVARIIALSGAAKVNSVTKDKKELKKYLDAASPIVKNEKEIADLCAQHAKDPLNPEFIEKLKGMLEISDFSFKDADSAKPIKQFEAVGFSDAIKEFWKEKASFTCTRDDLEEMLSKATKTKAVKQRGAASVVSPARDSFFTKEEIKNILDNLFGSEQQKTFTYKKLESVIGERAQNDSIKTMLKNIKWNSEKYFSSIQDYNKEVVGVVRGRLSRYLKLFDSVSTANADSVYTNTYSRTMKRMVGKLGYSIDSQKPLTHRIADFVNVKILKKAPKYTNDESKSLFYKVSDFIKIRILKENPRAVKATGHISLREIAQNEKGLCTDSLVKYFSNLVKDAEYGTYEYHKIIRDLTKTGLTGFERQAAERISDIENISLLEKRGIYPTLDKSVMGEIGTNSHVSRQIAQYATDQKTNIDAIVSRMAMCANFESRLKSGLIKIDGVDINKMPNAEEILKAARKLVYEGDRSAVDSNNAAGVINRSIFNKLVDSIYSEEAFAKEPVFIQEIAKKVRNFSKITDADKNSAVERYLANSNLTSLVKKYAEKNYGSYSWLKKAGIIGAVVVAITLLAQPFFGNIKKEFPKENKKEDGGAN